MKKFSFGLSIITCFSLLSMAGCNKEESSTAEKTSVIPPVSIEDCEFSKIPSPSIEWAELPKTLEELIEESDFVAEIEVADKITELGSGERMYSDITPNIKKVYKGSYNGNIIRITDGYMDYDSYIHGNDYVLSADENYKETKYVYSSWYNNYIPEIGDTLIFFGIEADGGYYASPSYQGLFRCEGDKVSNQALGLTEFLTKSLMNDFPNAEIVPCTYRLSSNPEVLSIPKKDFVSKIDDIV